MTAAAPSADIRIWLALDHHQAFQVGGWAFVRRQGGEFTGVAGGARRTGAGRNAVAGLAAALADLPPGASVTVAAADPGLVALWAAATGQGGDPPAEDLDLWAQVLAAARGRTVRLVRTAAAPATPLAFAAAWAELARDKAKMKGDFASAIPKPNLSKVQGL